MRETVTSSRKTSHSGERPISVRSPSWEEALTRPAASCADDERRPLAREVLHRCAGVVGDLLRRVGHRLLAGLALSREARAAAGEKFEAAGFWNPHSPQT